MTSYPISLGGQGYMLDMATYRRTAADLFSPRRSDGELSYSDLALGGGVPITSWSGGHGVVSAVQGSESAYRWGAGLDGYTAPGAVQLGLSPANVASDAGFQGTGIRCALVWNGSLWFADDGGSGDTRIYEWDGSTLTLRHTWTGKSAGATVMVAFLHRLVVANAGDGVVISTTDGASWSTLFTVSSVTGVHCLLVAQMQASGTFERLYIIADEQTVSPGTLRARVYYYDPSSGAGSLQFTVAEGKARCLANLEGTLVFCGVETTGQHRASLYTYNGTMFQRMQAIQDNAPLCSAVYRGKLYLGMAERGEIWSWDGAALEHAHTLRLDQGASGYTAPIRAMTVFDGALWVGRWDSTYKAGLERFDGEAWSFPVYGGDALLTAVRSLVVWGNTLYFSADASSSAHVIQKVAAWAYPSSARTLETSVYDAGLPDVSKSLRELTVGHAALASGESIEAQYRLEDTGAWTSLGTSSTLAATGKTFTFSAATAGKRFALRFLLDGGGSSTPKLESGVLRYVLAPGVKRVWKFEVILDGVAEMPLVTLDGTAESLTGEQLSALLWTLKDGAGPVTYVDLDGVSRAAWMTGYQERIAEQSQRRGRTMRGLVELVQA